MKKNKADFRGFKIHGYETKKPAYYVSTFDTVDLIDALPFRLPFLVGDTIKRIVRFEHKEPAKDLAKIKYNIERLRNCEKAKKRAKKIEKKKFDNFLIFDLIETFIKANNLSGHQGVFIERLVLMVLDNELIDPQIKHLENLIQKNT